jgi:hypothetical protein
VAEEAVRDDQAVECLVAVGVDREGPIQWVDGLTGLLPQQGKPSQLKPRRGAVWVGLGREPPPAPGSVRVPLLKTDLAEPIHRLRVSDEVDGLVTGASRLANGMGRAESQHDDRRST